MVLGKPATGGGEGGKELLGAQERKENLRTRDLFLERRRPRVSFFPW